MTYLNEIKAKLKNKIYSILHSNMLHDISYFTSPSMLGTLKIYLSTAKLQSTKKWQDELTKFTKLSKLPNEGDRSPIYTKIWEVNSLMRVHESLPIPLEL